MSQTVSEFLTTMKAVFKEESSFQNVTILGEVSNFKAHQSGHFYFSLKDDAARIQCVMFRSSAHTVDFKPKDGDKVLITGRADIFEVSGQVQLYISSMKLDGLGQLYLQLEKLKKHYYNLGYFSDDLKKAIPPYPMSVGVISGKGSAAHADIRRTLDERWPLAQVFDYFAYVQGDLSKDSLVKSIELAHQDQVDVIILARGGGSIEDLWSFNEPSVIEAVHASVIPIISGVGHEVDVTLVDYVSDYRAATPTAAAAKAVPDQDEVYLSIRTYMNQMYQSVRNKVVKGNHVLELIQKQGVFAQPATLIDYKQQRLDYLITRLERSLQAFIRQQSQFEQFESQGSHKIHLMVQSRLNLVSQLELQMMQKMSLILKDQSIQLEHTTFELQSQTKTFSNKIDAYKNVMSGLQSQNLRQLKQLLALNGSRFEAIINMLHERSPLKRMSGGYAFITKDDVPLLSVKDLDVGSEFQVRLQDGHVLAKVLEKDGNNHE